MPQEDARASVELWIQATARGLPVDRLLPAFQQAFDALWRRANLTLGDVTLMAIVDRVLHNAAERFPELAALTVEPAGIRTQALQERADGLRAEVLLEAFRFVLEEFVTVLGNLTADVLTAALSAELAKVSQEKVGR